MICECGQVISNSTCFSYTAKAGSAASAYVLRQVINQWSRIEQAISHLLWESTSNSRGCVMLVWAQENEVTASLTEATGWGDGGML